MGYLVLDPSRLVPFAPPVFHGDMQVEFERRREPRWKTESRMHVVGEMHGDSWRVGGKTINISARGLQFRSRCDYTPGTILYCAVPEHGIYARAQVCHSDGGWWRYNVGLRFLAAPLPED